MRRLFLIASLISVSVSFSFADELKTGVNYFRLDATTQTKPGSIVIDQSVRIGDKLGIGLGANNPSSRLDLAGGSVTFRGSGLEVRGTTVVLRGTVIQISSQAALIPVPGAGTTVIISSDTSGTTEGYWLDSAGNMTLQTPHDPKTGEWIFLSHNLLTGRTLRVDMERLVRRLEELIGEKFITEGR